MAGLDHLPPCLASDLDEILHVSESLFSELRGSRIFITGGTGFVGKWLLLALSRANRRLALDLSMVVLTRDRARVLAGLPLLATEPAVKFHIGDVRSFDYPDGDITHVIHMATTSAEETYNQAPPLDKFTTTVDGTRRVLDFAETRGVRKFLLVSSGNAYGPIAEGAWPVDESYPGAPDITSPVSSALGEAKRTAELLARIHADLHGIDVKICRCFTFIGPFLQTDIHYAAGNFIRDAVLGEAIRVRGDGTPVRSFMYPTDLITWLLTVLTKGESGRMYNIGAEQALSIAELANRIATKAGGRVVIEREGATRATASPDGYVPSTRRIREELGVRLQVDIDVAITRTLAFYRDTGLNPAA